MANKVEIEIDVDMNNEDSIKKLEDDLEQIDDTETDITIDGNDIIITKTKVDDLDESLKETGEDGEEAGEKIKDGADKAKGGLDGAKDSAENFQLSMQNISQGFSTFKQGASELGQVMSTALESAGKQETNFKFLEKGVGDAETARQKMSEINDIVKDLPGDDTAMQGLLSSAVAKDATLTTDALKNMGTSAADYFAAMSYYGKSASESQQDMTNYLLAGNTAELERSPILQAHIDKLKEATTVQERSQALAEALGEENWANMSQQDTFNNKLETFNGMLERGQYNLGGIFQEGAKGAMDFLLKLDEGTNGLVGMGIAAASFASPLSDTVIGIGQMATGLQALKSSGAASALAGMLPFIVADEEAFLGLALAEDFALWPILAIVAAMAALGLAVYEVGKYFGWWTDVGSMMDAISAGVQRLWSAFINNPDVQGFIQGIKDAWASIGPYLGMVINKVMEFFGISNSGEFDIVRALIDGIGVAWNIMKARIMLVINVVRTIIGVFSQVLSSISSFIQNVVSKFTALPGQIQSAISGLAGIITKPFNDAWGQISPIIDGIKNGVSTVSSWFSGAEYAGFSTDSVGYAGFGNDTLNSTLTNIANSSSNSSHVVNNFNVHGIIEEEASQYIVDSMTNHLRKQNLIRGV